MLTAPGGARDARCAHAGDGEPFAAGAAKRARQLTPHFGRLQQRESTIWPESPVQVLLKDT